MKSLLLAVGLLIAYPLSHSEAVSRVGGGKVKSQSSGFELELPAPFTYSEDIAGLRVKALGPVVFVANKGMISQYVEISEFHDDFAEVVNLSAQELNTRFTTNNWTALGNSRECVLILRNQSPSIAAYIVTWGSGKGLVLKGPRLPDVEKAMQSMLESLSITGGCAWK